MKILERMMEKYVKVIEFYTEAKNSEQVFLAKREFQEVLRVRCEVDRLFQVELKKNDEEIGELESDKVQFRIAHSKTSFAEDIFNAGAFNFTMIEWAIKEILKEEKE